MTMRLYRVTLDDGVRTREVHVPSPTDVQAGDAAAPLMQTGEAILSIKEVSPNRAPGIDADPPKSQAAELAPVTPGAAAAPEPQRERAARDQDRSADEPSIDGRQEVEPDEVEAGPDAHQVGENASGTALQDRVGGIDGDPAELNRGLGQGRVGEVGPGPLQRPLDPAAGGPGAGAGSSATPPS